MTIEYKIKKVFLFTGLLQPFLVNGKFYMYFANTVMGERLSWTSLGNRIRKTWDEQETAAINKYMKKGMVGLDIGSNVGYYALLMAQKCRRVYAFEPQPKFYRILQRNVRINNLGDKIETVMKGAYTKTDRLTFDNTEIDVVRLDDFFRGKQKPDIIKTDVDGVDVEVIEGGRQTFGNAKLVIYEDMTKGDKVGKKLEELGFKIKRLNKVNCMAVRR